MNAPTERFQLATEILGAVSPDDVEATFNDMVECGIASPPYDTFDVVLSFKAVERVIGSIDDMTQSEREKLDRDTRLLRFRFFDLDHILIDIANDGIEKFCQIAFLSGHKEHRIAAVKDERDVYLTIAFMVYRLLVVLLATRNIVKVRREHKLAKFGIGKKDGPRYTTHLSIGDIAVEDGGASSGGTVRPHLRRGHIRRQHHGPNLEFVKKVFIAAVFVNADEGFVSNRKAYNVSLSRQTNASVPTSIN